MKNEVTMTNDSKRESIINKINKLKEKTIANGCTESEAISTMEIISRLLQKYDLTMSDIESRSQHFKIVEIFVKGARKTPIHELITSISYLTDTKVFYSNNKNGYTYKFFGSKNDTEYAEYLFKLLSYAIDNEYKVYKTTNEYQSIGGKLARPSYFKGMTSRLSYRIREIKNSIVNESKEFGLMLYDKKQIAEDMFKQMNPNTRIKMVTSRTVVSDVNAYLSGKKAADRVNITKAIN
jgi:uncharacterized protein (UPF0305 family)